MYGGSAQISGLLPLRPSCNSLGKLCSHKDEMDQRQQCLCLSEPSASYGCLPFSFGLFQSGNILKYTADKLRPDRPPMRRECGRKPAVRRNRNSTAIHPFGVCRTYGKIRLGPSFCYRPHFGCYSLGSYRLSYTEVVEGSAGEIPDGEMASGGETASGSKVGPVYIHRHLLLLR